MLIVLAIPVSISKAEVRTFAYQGEQRFYRLFNAENRTETPRPLVLHLHGFRSKETTLKDRATLDYMRWKKLEDEAAKQNFILVSPAAYHGQWRLFPNLKNVVLPSGEEVDDVGYIFELVSFLVDDGLVNGSRIYLTGISDGAILAYHLMCFETSPFIAVVAIVGSMYESHLKDCPVKNPPALLVVAGTNDPILPYDGWIFPTGREVSVPETMDFWRRKHKCSGQKAKKLDDLEPEDGSQILLVEWTGCFKSGAVKLLRAEGSGHAVPDFDAVSEGWLKKSGGQNRDISSAEEAWHFFKRFSK